MMKRLERGTLVRLTENLHGDIVLLGKDRARVRWKRTRGKGQVVREAFRWFPLDEIVPAGEADQAKGIAWRLQYFVQDGRGAALPSNQSNASKTSRKPWSPYTPED